MCESSTNRLINFSTSANLLMEAIRQLGRVWLSDQGGYRGKDSSVSMCVFVCFNM